MDFENLRSYGVDYSLIDRNVQNYEMYENVYVGNESKGSLAIDVRSSEEKRLLKLEINRARMAERRANETEQERALRLYKNKMRNKLRRATETPEQRADRNRRNMERNRERRNKQRTTVNNSCPTVVDECPSNVRKVRYYINDLLKVELSSSPPHQLHNISNTEFSNRYCVFFAIY